MIGDFWGAEKGDSFWNDKGVSVIFAHTEKGKKFLEKTPGIRLYPTDFEKAVANNQMVIRARKVSPEREKFEKLFAEKGLIYAARRSKSLKTRMELFAIRVIPPQIRTFLRKGYCQIKNKISPPDSNSHAAEKKAS